MNKPTRDLISAYKKIRPEIKKRLAEFAPLHKSSDEKIFSELCYCILTANANATRCNEAIVELEKNGLLLKGEPRHIRPVIKGKARFHNKKAEYIAGDVRNPKDLKKAMDGINVVFHLAAYAAEGLRKDGLCGRSKE